MSVLQLRKELHQYIDKADERLVRAVYAMMQNYLEDDNSIVAYTTSGEPLTKEEYIKNVTTAYNEAKQGDIMSNEDLRNEVEKWGNEKI